MNHQKFLCGIFGFPIAHSASPAMQNAAFRALGLEGVYLPFEILPRHLEKAMEAIRVLNFAGVNVTIPYKEKVIPYLDALSPEAKLIGAVNTIQNKEGRLIGHNTDAPGIKRALEEGWGRSLKNANVVLLGAGGAARAVAVQAGLSGVRKIVIINRSRRRLKNLILHLKESFPKMQVRGFSSGDSEARSEVLEADCLVNATPLGMSPMDPEPCPPRDLDPRTYVYDLVYRPMESHWVKEAIERGCRGSGGSSMLLYQGALAFKIWTGHRPPIEVMRQALMECLKG
ncbi:MAG: shikimate dehydrogenase [Chlamydiae bacterium]|nr:shikimate dehydrogenase [Chlamydiota bacterium]MBI3265691.1 shikimate dehydrogenase [Chlamydiota bacterium]